MKVKIVLPLLMVLACTAGFAQSGPPDPSFDVASIRAIEPGLRHEKSIDDEPGRLTMRSVTLRDCIQWAYEVEPAQITGPAWLGDARFDVAAKAADPAGTERLRLMLRSLLADRFGLKLHREQKELSVYTMIVAPNGPKFHEPGPKDASKFVESTSEGPPVLSDDKTGLVAERVRISDIATVLSQPLERPVIDKTGLKGRYDIRIDITAFMTSAGEGDSHGPVDMIGIIFSAFPAQLGLKLQPGKDMVDFLVIEAVNKTPTDN